jgi:ATP-binding cassette subfamily B (MDR/TAP) protein 1
MTTIAPQILVVTKAAGAAEELFRTIDRTSEIDSLSEDGIIPDTCNGHIEVEKIDFAYPARPDIPVLNGLSLSVPANKTMALVGASGSGKSTIIGLLEQWYRQAEGTIRLDGTDIRELNLRWLRTNMRLVQQEPTLFSGSVYDNVAFGLYGTEKSDLSQDKQRDLVEKACKAAYADEFIQRLPKVCLTVPLTFGTLICTGLRDTSWRACYDALRRPETKACDRAKYRFRPQGAPA